MYSTKCPRDPVDIIGNIPFRPRYEINEAFLRDDREAFVDDEEDDKD
jgi:hypothetical protein